MRLVPIAQGQGASGATDTATGDGAASRPDPGPPAGTARGEILFYRHPMNPEVTSPVPAKDEMGMDFVPVYAEEARGDRGASVPGMATVEVRGEAVQLAGVRTAAATRQHVGQPTRTVGLVVPDERRIRRVTTRVAGWVERLYVNYTGQEVRAGQPVLSIYSPELLASQEELLRARQAAARFRTSSLEEVRRGGEDLVVAARRRLELFDVPRGFIATLERTGKPQRAVTLVAPSSGFVSAKDVFEGQQVEPGRELFTLTDLSQVWVQAEFYQADARLVRVGQQARVSLPYAPGASYPATVSFIQPTLEPQARTLQVRLELANPKGELRPGMFVDVVADLQGGEGVAVPEDAVIDTGTRQVVFVERQPGVFEPREVRVGVRGEGRALLLSGVREGERVATRANFLLDSESRLRAAIAGAGGDAP
jgi:RND family efflux transporter MFP subunit